MTPDEEKRIFGANMTNVSASKARIQMWVRDQQLDDGIRRARRQVEQVRKAIIRMQVTRRARSTFQRPHRSMPIEAIEV